MILEEIKHPDSDRQTLLGGKGCLVEKGASCCVDETRSRCNTNIAAEPLILCADIGSAVAQLDESVDGDDMDEPTDDLHLGEVDYLEHGAEHVLHADEIVERIQYAHFLSMIKVYWDCGLVVRSLREVYVLFVWLYGLHMVRPANGAPGVELTSVWGLVPWSTICDILNNTLSQDELSAFAKSWKVPTDTMPPECPTLDTEWLPEDRLMRGFRWSTHYLAQLHSRAPDASLTSSVDAAKDMNTLTVRVTHLGLFFTHKYETLSFDEKRQRFSTSARGVH